MKSVLRMGKERDIHYHTFLLGHSLSLPIQFLRHQMEKVKEQGVMGVRERRNV